MVSIEAVVGAWQDYLRNVDRWEDLVEGVTPESSGCGMIYALGNPLNRPNEDYAIADMRELKITEPHYHRGHEIYIVLEGSGKVVLGAEERGVEKGSVVVIPVNTAHYTIPGPDLVLAAINTPPFSPDDYLVVTETNPAVRFDAEQFKRLTPTD